MLNPLGGGAAEEMVILRSRIGHLRSTAKCLWALAIMGVVLCSVLLGVCAQSSDEERSHSPASLSPYVRLQAQTQPVNVSIAQIDPSKFPIIELYALVTDQDGNSISGLTAGNFLVTEQSNLESSPTTESISATPITGRGGITVALVIDRSGSMSGSEIADAKTGANSFIDNLVTLDRAAIISFSSSVTVNQAFTSDKSALQAAVNSLSAGGGTALYNAIYRAVEELTGELGVKAVVIFTDGQSNSGSHTVQEAIDLAKARGIPVYTIGLGSGVNEGTLQTIANETGAYYTFAPAASDLQQIYNDIAQSIRDQYLVTYSTHNSNYDGTTRTVEATATAGADSDSDTTTYSVTQPPQIDLAQDTTDLMSQAQYAGQILTIGANITDDVAVTKAKLFYRHSGSGGIYTEVEMTSSSDLYTADIPASGVVTPGVDFYVTATDGTLTSSAPQNNPATYPHQIAILPNEAPVIVHTAVTTAVVGASISITADVTDTTDRVDYVKLFYRTTGYVLYDSLDMLSSSDTYTATIPGAKVTSAGVDYYVMASDNHTVKTYDGTDVSPHQITITATCNEMPEEVLQAAGELRSASIGTVVGYEEPGGILDQVAYETAKRTIDLTFTLGLMGLKHLLHFEDALKGFLKIPETADPFKDMNVAYGLGLVTGANCLVDTLRECASEFWGMPSLTPYLALLMGFSAWEEEINTSYDSFRADPLCPPEELAGLACDILGNAQTIAGQMEENGIGPAWGFYDACGAAKSGVTVLQVAAIAGGAIGALFSGGSSLAIGVTAAQGLETVKLGLTVAEVGAVVAMWAKAPSLANDVYSIATLGYEQAHIVMSNGSATYPNLEYESVQVPGSIAIGELAPGTLVVRNTSDSDVHARLYLTFTYSYLGLLPLPFEFPAGPSTKIKAASTEQFVFPVFTPPQSLCDIAYYISPFPHTMTIGGYIEYGILAPYGTRTELGDLATVSLEPPLVSIFKGVAGFVGEYWPFGPKEVLLEADSSTVVQYEVTLTVVSYSNVGLTTVTVEDTVPASISTFEVTFNTPPTKTTADGRRFTWELSLKPKERRYIRYTVLTSEGVEGQLYSLPGAEVRYIDGSGELQTVKSAAVVDNIYAQSIEVKGLHSLPEKPVARQHFKLAAIIGNPETEEVHEAIVTVRLPEDLVCAGELTKVVDSIPAGGTTTVEWDVEAAQAGSFMVAVEVQALGRAGDLRELEVNVTGGGPTCPTYVFHGPNPVPAQGCIFWLNLPDDTSSATINIFDIDGAGLVDIPLDLAINRYPQTGRWLPQDDQGRLLGTGLYLYVVKIKHTDGTTTYSPIHKMVISR